MYTLYLNNDGIVTEVPVTYGEYLNGVTTPVKRGHTFNGWYDGERFYLKMDAVTGNNVISYYPYTHEGFIHIYYSPATRALAEEENIMTGKEQTENNLLPFWNGYNETANIISEELTDEGRIVDPYVLGQPVTDGIVLSDRKIRLQ